MREHPEQQPLLWRRPWWARASVAAALWALLVVYGSLLPFEFDLSRAGWDRLALSTTGSPIEDLALNLALYVPLGVLLRLALGRWWPSAATVALMSYGLECAQGLTPHRVGSWHDVAANTLPAIVAAALTPWLVRGFHVAAFACYRRCVQTGDALRALRQRGWLLFAVVAVNAALIAAWSTTLTSPAKPSAALAINWLPFADHFARSYDVAVLYLGRSLLVYCVLGMLLSVAMMRKRQRRPLLGVALTTAVLVAAQQALRGRADVTEPIVALIAVSLVFSTAWLFIHAVRRSCRRRNATPVAHERRRRTHDYAFAVR